MVVVGGLTDPYLFNLEYATLRLYLRYVKGTIGSIKKQPLVQSRDSEKSSWRA